MRTFTLTQDTRVIANGFCLEIDGSFRLNLTKTSDGHKTMTFKELREHIALLVTAQDDLDGPHDREDCPCGHPEGTRGACAGCNCADEFVELDDMEVIVRVQSKDGETMVGGLFDVNVDAGCTEVEAVVLDASQDVAS